MRAEPVDIDRLCPEDAARLGGVAVGELEGVGIGDRAAAKAVGGEAGGAGEVGEIRLSHGEQAAMFEAFETNAMFIASGMGDEQCAARGRSAQHELVLRE